MQLYSWLQVHTHSFAVSIETTKTPPLKLNYDSLASKSFFYLFSFYLSINNLSLAFSFSLCLSIYLYLYLTIYPWLTYLCDVLYSGAPEHDPAGGGQHPGREHLPLHRLQAHPSGKRFQQKSLDHIIKIFLDLDNWHLPLLCLYTFWAPPSTSARFVGLTWNYMYLLNIFRRNQRLKIISSFNILYIPYYKSR